jgi:hypothetical protein
VVEFVLLTEWVWVVLVRAVVGESGDLLAELSVPDPAELVWECPDVP